MSKYRNSILELMRRPRSLLGRYDQADQQPKVVVIQKNDDSLWTCLRSKVSGRLSCEESKKCFHLQVCPIDLDGLKLFCLKTGILKPKLFKFLPILSIMGHICKICKKTWTTLRNSFFHEFYSTSLAFVLYWAFSWWNCSPWPWLAWEFTSTTLKMAHFHAIWHQQQMLPPLQVSHNELQKNSKVALFFCTLLLFHKILF